MDPIFDEKEALSRLGDNRDLLLQISAYFVSYAKIQIDLLSEAFDNSDFEGMKFITHKLLGSVANFGANAAYADGLKLQEALANDQKAKIPELYRAYIKKVNQLKTELSEFSKGVDPPEI
jgi:HPt (histidine-containing phosphotransfer) domain-containing protein